MVTALHWIIVIGICFTSLLSVFFSLKARRQHDVRLRGLYAARLNMSMGIMLLLIAIFFMLAYSGSTIKVIIGSLFLLIGLFNLFAGLRNHSVYNAMKP
ncbi:YtpI family protein [Paenibacillus oenotherae]|uniref:YtpI family protein n=1 Tax=Paenibacillus oenotherae TaxID=1435645 RepID=A0ABS7DAR7_9BACL|nr:YtpI family protein [Paenibacillus oenotherae]MBW7477034.1 YtpI family protein [Paenibacillus oenotherae]